jgi:uncharacterized repeat protein (TIGR03803 family)
MKKCDSGRMICAAFVIWTASAIASCAQTLTTLVIFNGSNGSGSLFAPLVQGTDGNFYGTTAYGGANCATMIGCGTVFKVSPAGRVTSLYSFCSQASCSDGSYPITGLVLATDGNFYGTTWLGGANGDYGTIFKITRAGKLTTLYSFCTHINCADGYSPMGELIQAADGNLYGTTALGGLVGPNCSGGCGTVFKITLKGVFTSLHSFTDTNLEGFYPRAGLLQAPSGIFYGATAVGGPNLNGTIFELTSAGHLTTIHDFAVDGTDGAQPWGTLVLGQDGDLYGTTETAGAFYGGTVFKIDLTLGNTLTTIYNFCSLPFCQDGSQPETGLTLGTNGNLYGTTVEPNAFARGTAFNVTPEGVLTTLYQFCTDNPNCPDGSFPYANPIQATNGKFYGTTAFAGNYNCNPGTGCGTVYSLDTGLGPFVSFIRNRAKAGQPFDILGNGLKRTTGVSLNGTAATFTIKSDTLIVATVPAGATTGYVTVTMPGGTLTSNVPFYVIP